MYSFTFPDARVELMHTMISMKVMLSNMKFKLDVMESLRLSILLFLSNSNLTQNNKIPSLRGDFIISYNVLQLFSNLRDAKNFLNTLHEHFYNQYSRHAPKHRR